jgi:HEAT repeat protein
LRSHAKPDARALAAENLAKCHDADAVPALIAALEKDTVSDVRSWCISALVEIGDTRARAALEKAASSDPDEGIRKMAERWLKKLK